MTAQQLYDAALAATARSHAPHSGLHVGAALEAEDGTLIPGANVEFGSYGLTICAERTALVKAVTEGHMRFRRIGVARADGLPISPCGMCRQSLADFGLDIVVVYRAPEGIVEQTVGALLPGAFRFGDG